MTTHTDTGTAAPVEIGGHVSAVPRDNWDASARVERNLETLRRRTTTLAIAWAVSYAAYAFVLVALTILVFGFVLQLFAANPDAPFAQWVYRHLDDVMAPFRGLFPRTEAPTGSTVDVSILFAIFVYGLVAVGIRSMLDWLTFRRDRLERQMWHEEHELLRMRGAGGNR